MNRWRWRQSTTGESMTLFRVDHYLTRDEIAELVCVSDTETGTRMSQALVVYTVHEGLRSALNRESIEYCEAGDARREWAWQQAQQFYERTSR